MENRTRNQETGLSEPEKSSLPRVLEFIERKHWDAEIRVEAMDVHGTVYCEAGLVVDAELGQSWGHEALVRILEIRQARIRVRSRQYSEWKRAPKPTPPASLKSADSREISLLPFLGIAGILVVGGATLLSWSQPPPILNVGKSAQIVEVEGKSVAVASLSVPSEPSPSRSLVRQLPPKRPTVRPFPSDESAIPVQLPLQAGTATVPALHQQHSEHKTRLVLPSSRELLPWPEEPERPQPVAPQPVIEIIEIIEIGLPSPFPKD